MNEQGRSLRKEVLTSFEQKSFRKDGEKTQRDSAKQSVNLADAFSKQIKESDNLDVSGDGKIAAKPLFKIDPKELPRIVSQKHLRTLQKEFENTPINSHRYHELFIRLARGIRGSNFTPSKKKEKQKRQIVNISRKQNRGVKKGFTALKGK